MTVFCGMPFPPKPLPTTTPQQQHVYTKLPFYVSNRIVDNSLALYRFLGSVDSDVASCQNASASSEGGSSSPRSRDEWPESALNRYRMFLYLKQKYPGVWLVPTLEVEFCWLAHIFRTATYRKDMTLTLSNRVDPEHSLCMIGDDENEQKAYTKAVQATATLWRKEFGVDYTTCTELSWSIWNGFPLEGRSDPRRYFPRVGSTIRDGSTPLFLDLPKIGLTKQDVAADLGWYRELQTALKNELGGRIDTMQLKRLFKEKLVLSYERYLNLVCKMQQKQQQQSQGTVTANGFLFGAPSSSMAVDVGPPIVLDLLWHAHQMEPALYNQECTSLFQREFLHDPWPKGLGVASELSAQFQCAWKQEYGTPILDDNGKLHDNSNDPSIGATIPPKILQHMTTMAWSLPSLDESQLEGLVSIGLEPLSQASVEVKAPGIVSKIKALHLDEMLSESRDIFLFINNQWMRVTGAPHAVSLYNMSCLLSLQVELELRFLKSSTSTTFGSTTEAPTTTLLAMAMQHESTPLASSSSQLPLAGGRGIAKIGSQEETVGLLMKKQLEASKACLVAAIAAGWSDMEHMKTDPDLQALHELLPDPA